MKKTTKKEIKAIQRETGLSFEEAKIERKKRKMNLLTETFFSDLSSILETFNQLELDYKKKQKDYIVDIMRNDEEIGMYN